MQSRKFSTVWRANLRKHLRYPPMTHRNQPPVPAPVPAGRAARIDRLLLALEFKHRALALEGNPVELAGLRVSACVDGLLIGLALLVDDRHRMTAFLGTEVVGLFLKGDNRASLTTVVGVYTHLGRVCTIAHWHDVMGRGTSRQHEYAAQNQQNLHDRPPLACDESGRSTTAGAARRTSAKGMEGGLPRHKLSPLQTV